MACDQVWAGEESASSSAIALHYRTSGGSTWPCINLSFPRSKRQCVTRVCLNAFMDDRLETTMSCVLLDDFGAILTILNNELDLYKMLMFEMAVD